jgi:RND family efflux transporter MFP subunit
MLQEPTPPDIAPQEVEPDDSDPLAAVPTPNKRRLAVVGIVVLVAAGVAVFHGVTSRAQTEQGLATWANAQATPTVAVVRPEPNKGVQNLTLPGTIQAYFTAPIYARVPGYVKTWSHDIGDKVRKGDVLAEIDTPDIDQQLAQVQANLASATAAEKLSALTAVRWHQLLAYQTVSQQDADEKISDAQSKHAAMQAAQANVAQLEAMSGFKHIVAPFDGIITARSTDIGALVNAGSSAASALFQVSDIKKVRIYVQMPQAYAADLRPGLQASLSLPQYPDRTFDATLVGTANSFAEATRTVSVQLLADNPDGKLWPGTYTEVTFHIPADPHILRVPSTALVFGAHGMQVATLGADGKVVFKPIKLGRDLGNDAEILSGVTLADQVILSPPEWLSNGDTVKVLQTAAAPTGQDGVKVAEQSAASGGAPAQIVK